MTENPATSPRQSLMVRRSNHQAPWFVAGCAVVILGIPLGTSRLDRSWRGDIDPFAAETPVNWAKPFDGTRSEVRLKLTFHEPLVTQTPAAAPSGNAKNADSEESAISPAAMVKAHKIYEERCASCHGEKGNGDGPGAFAVKPRPRDYTDAEWQKTVTDEELAKAIVKGGAAVGKSYMMPANYDLRSKPEVAAGLVQIVRSFAQQ